MGQSLSLEDEEWKPTWQKCKKLQLCDRGELLVLPDNTVLFVNFNNGYIHKYDRLKDKIMTKIETRIASPTAQNSIFAYFTGNKQQIMKKLHFIEIGLSKRSPCNKSKLFYINNCLQIIGGAIDFPYHINTTHLPLQDALKGTIEPNFQFPPHFDFRLSDLIYVKSKNMLLLFLMSSEEKRSSRNKRYYESYIYSYSIDNDSWNKVDTKIPCNLYHCGIALVPGDKYIIICNANLQIIGYKSDIIFIYDIQKEWFYQSDIHSPYKLQVGINPIQAAVISDYVKLEMLICGYIRRTRCIKYSIISHDLIRNICRLTGEYSLHIFQYVKPDMSANGWIHQRMRCCDILQNMMNVNWNLYCADTYLNKF